MSGMRTLVVDKIASVTQALGLAQRNPDGTTRVLPWDRPRLVSGAANRPRPQRAAAGGGSAAQEY